MYGRGPEIVEGILAPNILNTLNSILLAHACKENMMSSKLQLHLTRALDVGSTAGGLGYRHSLNPSDMNSRGTMHAASVPSSRKSADLRDGRGARVGHCTLV